MRVLVFEFFEYLWWSAEVELSERVTEAFTGVVKSIEQNPEELTRQVNNMHSIPMGRTGRTLLAPLHAMAAHAPVG